MEKLGQIEKPSKGEQEKAGGSSDGVKWSRWRRKLIVDFSPSQTKTLVCD